MSLLRKVLISILTGYTPQPPKGGVAENKVHEKSPL